jgi:hypothetical protein
MDIEKANMYKVAFTSAGNFPLANQKARPCSRHHSIIYLAARPVKKSTTVPSFKLRAIIQQGPCLIQLGYRLYNTTLIPAVGNSCNRYSVSPFLRSRQLS